MARQIQSGGARVVFPRHVGDSLLDLKALRREIEEAEGLSERKGTAGYERARWTQYRDLMEAALDVRIDLLGRDALSHERALAGQRTSMCGAYECSEPSCDELRCLAAARREARVAA